VSRGEALLHWTRPVDVSRPGVFRSARLLCLHHLTRTHSYMENNKHIFIMADADAILASLRGQVGRGLSWRRCGPCWPAHAAAKLTAVCVAAT
jgi:hypothetical protein